ncbi:hypothetical protein BU16DRAFT_567376 [Lophium mytilinum]|uniref:Uncharacterized protein n=1 Tax=Lophium mytilinum TaxID=390894 RepID=A0A6A6QCL0_9PEZI|nr:hypothetical protein BU16DRAFT_567376 [Lophium mytilinum]
MPAFTAIPTPSAAHFERIVKQFVEPAWQQVAGAIFNVVVTSCQEQPEKERRMCIGVRGRRFASRRVLKVKGKVVGVGRGKNTAVGLTEEELKAILNYNACEAAPKILGPIVEKIFQDYAKIEVATMPVGPRLVVQYPEFEDEDFYLHCVFKITFKNGEVWFLDLTYSQFGFDSCWTPEREYRTLYQKRGVGAERDSCRPVGQNYGMYPPEEPEDRRRLNDHLRESLNFDFSLFCLEHDKNIHQIVNDGGDNGQELKALLEDLGECADNAVTHCREVEMAMADLAHG